MRSAAAGILAHAFLLQLAAYLIRPTAAYQAISLGADPAAVGWVTASFAVLPLIVAVWAGRWIDAGRGPRALVVGSILMIASGIGLLFAAADLWALLAWNAIIGLGHLLSVLGEQNAVAQRAGGGMDRAFGRYTFVASAGQAVAPALMAVLGGSAVIPDTTTLLVAYVVTCTVMGAVSLWCAVALRRSPAAGPSERTTLRSALALSPDRRRWMFGGMFASMFVLAAIDLVQVYLPALGVERGIPSGVIGVLLALRAAATMFSRLGLSWLSRTVGRGRLITVATLIGAVSVGAIALDVPVAVIGVLLVIGGATLGIGQPLSMSVVSLASPPGALATWLAIRLSGNRLGQSLIPAAVSLFAVGSGTMSVFLATGVMLLGTAAVTGLTLRGGGPGESSEL